MAAFVIGIDLGTTNCSVAYARTDDDSAITALPIDQVVAPGTVEARTSLPSFALLANEHEVSPESVALPWNPKPRVAVGTFARDRGSELPHRLVASAKSWLSYTGVDRTAQILPWRGTADAEDDGGLRLSPVAASGCYLAHIREAWNEHQPDHPLDEQDVYLTVPASFDAVAKDLTVRAADEAGLGEVTLLEEPQAAFYAWLAQTGDGWRDKLSPGDVVLVCDVGGGTTDFSLITVKDDGGGNLELERSAVGDHILLGGDNMDLALAYGVIARLGSKGKKLKAMQRRALIHACRRSKEQLLAEDAPEQVKISILGTGSKLIGGTIRAELKRSDVETLLLDGFFPKCDADAETEERKAVGLKELGLPYAHDPAVTRHLAEFLARHDQAPTAILWNGGVMKGELLRKRVGETIASWFGGEARRSLAGTDLDLAVSHGAAYYGLVRQGKGIRIRGGTARAYYIGVETAMPAIPGFAPPVNALCVAPAGMEEGSSVGLPEEELGLVVGETATFRFFASSTRKQDAPGTVIDPDEEELHELDPVETQLSPDGDVEAGDVVPVSLQSKVTELGTLELWCVSKADPASRWKLEYSVRDDG